MAMPSPAGGPEGGPGGEPASWIDILPPPEADLLGPGTILLMVVLLVLGLLLLAWLAWHLPKLRGLAGMHRLMRRWRRGAIAPRQSLHQAGRLLQTAWSANRLEDLSPPKTDTDAWRAFCRRLREAQFSAREPDGDRVAALLRETRRWLRAAPLRRRAHDG